MKAFTRIRPRTLQEPATTLAALRPAPHHLVLARSQFARRASSAPNVLQPTFWKSLIPKPLRRRSEQPDGWGQGKSAKAKGKKEWNPATFYIAIFMLIGSMSIQMLIIKRDFGHFVRRAEVRIGLLREVVEKLQRGEDVDVEKTLGTGDEAQEKAWEEMLQEIEQDDVLKAPKEAKKPKQPAPAPAPAPVVPETKTEPKNEPKIGGTSPANTKTTGYSTFF